MFLPDQFVVVEDEELWGGAPQLATVARQLPVGGSSYEVCFLVDHEPGAASDIIRCVGGSEMRSATREEIEKAKKDWEEEHQHLLSFRIEEREDALFTDNGQAEGLHDAMMQEIDDDRNVALHGCGSHRPSGDNW